MGFPLVTQYVPQNRMYIIMQTGSKVLWPPALMFVFIVLDQVFCSHNVTLNVLTVPIFDPDPQKIRNHSCFFWFRKLDWVVWLCLELLCLSLVHLSVASSFDNSSYPNGWSTCVKIMGGVSMHIQFNGPSMSQLRPWEYSKQDASTSHATPHAVDIKPNCKEMFVLALKAFACYLPRYLIRKLSWYLTGKSNI